MRVNGTNIELTFPQWRIIEEILYSADQVEFGDDVNTVKIPSTALRDALFMYHGRYSDSERNRFLIPLIDHLSELSDSEVQLTFYV